MKSLKKALSHLFESESKQENHIETLSDLFKKSYPEFVPLLSKLTMDDEFMNSLEGDGSESDKLKIETINVKCKDLIPLQNEIGASESLDFPLQNRIKKESVIKMCSNEVCDSSVYDSQGRTIITSGGKYIVDGHHRWSSAYILNPDCIIQVKDIGKYKKGVDALKLSQIIIAVLSKAKGKMGSKKAKGLNIIDAPSSEIKKHIESVISDDFVKTFMSANKDLKSKEQVVSAILKNCIELQKSGIDSDAHANDRGIMPQFDDKGVYLKGAEQGAVNMSDIKTAMKEHKNLVKEWKQLIKSI
jgi:hypothetical protein